MTDLFCPIYKEALDAKPWDNAPQANRGLLFDKFASAWRKKGDKYEFDKGIGNKNESAGAWLRKMTAISGEAKQISEACSRQRQLVKAMGGNIVLVRNASRFVTGVGREHPLESGFTWHHTLGVPYLPGSSLKGLLRAWYREEVGGWNKDHRGNSNWFEEEATKAQFGSQAGVGQFSLLDMLPTKPTKLVVDILTPHYGPYYQDKTGQTAPGDWHSPIPIPFLAVEEGQSWQLAILPSLMHRRSRDDDLRKLEEQLVQAFSWLGVGAKTAVGYGRFDHDQEAQEIAHRDDQRRQAELSEQKALNAELSGLPPAVAKLVKLARKELWINDKNQNANFLNGIETYLEQFPNPSEACIHWLRDNCLELFWKGIWNDPDAMTGKKKDKNKHKSKRARELTHRLKNLLPSE